MNKKTLINTSLIAATLVSTSAFADIKISNQQCDIELNYDLSITPDHVRIIDNDHTIIDIYQDQMLFIKGEKINLNRDQQQWVTDYAKHIRKSVPEVALIATEALGVAYEGINVALGSHVDLGDTKAKFDALQQKLNTKFQSESGQYTFKQGEFSSNMNDSEINTMVEDIVEEMVPQMVGSIIANIGTAIAKGETNLSELENLGDTIEKEVEQRAAVVEEKAEAFCNRLKDVDKLETQLVASNRAFSHFDLLHIK